MSRPRFLADHDLNEHIVTGVLRREPLVEFVRVRDVGYNQRPDVEVLEYATSEGLVIVSHDVNTMPAAAHERLGNGANVSGLLMVRQTDPVAPIIEVLLLIWSASEAEEWRGQVQFLPL
jgi:hypothetical protein